MAEPSPKASPKAPPTARELAPGPLSLGICASQRELSCVLRRTDGSLLQDELCREARGAQVAQAVQRLFKLAGHQAAELREIRIDVGPGSYTGLRVAVTFARFLLAYSDVQVLRTTSLELCAVRAWRDGLVPLECPIRPVLDARRERFHTSLLNRGGEDLQREPVRAIPHDELLAAIGTEFVLAEPPLHERLSETVEACQATMLPIPAWSAADLYDDELKLIETQTEELEPLYLMASYAE